jgi:lysophospholipase L1-like esterase
MQLRSASSSYDVILIQAGPNDVLSFHNLDASKQDAKALLTLAKEKSQHVVMLSGGNAGLVPLLPWPISELISERTRTVRSFLIALTGERQVAYVDLYKKRSEDEFSQNPKLFYAQDGLHPADSGYALWYTRIRETISAAYPTLVL